MEDYEKWLNKSEEDFSVANYNFDGDKTEAGFFFLQQAAEKSLKAVYIKKFNDLLKAHDLFLIARKVDAPKKILEYCKKLTPAYQYTRYPDVSFTENLNDLKEDFIFYCEEIIKWCKENI